MLIDITITDKRIRIASDRASLKIDVRIAGNRFKNLIFLQFLAHLQS